MDNLRPEETTVLVRLTWRASPQRVQALRSRPVFGCTARLRGGKPADLFSIVLRWLDDSSAAHLTLLVQTPDLRPIAAHLTPGQVVDVTEDGHRILAEATVIETVW